MQGMRPQFIQNYKIFPYLRRLPNCVLNNNIP